MTHVVTHLRSVDDTAVETAEAAVLHGRTVTIVKAARRSARRSKNAPSHASGSRRFFSGSASAGNNAVEQLRGSANPAVRRTAIYLLREFGGSEALPDLTTLLDDTEPHVQREAVRAILSIGTEEAYAELQRALATRHEPDARSA